MADLTQLPAARAKALELEGQVAAFDSPEVKARRQTISLRRTEREALEEEVNALNRWLDELPVNNGPVVALASGTDEDGGLAEYLWARRDKQEVQ